MCSDIKKQKNPSTIYVITWIRCQNNVVCQTETLQQAKQEIADRMIKYISDLRFTEISLLAEKDDEKEYVVDYYGKIIACITIENKE